MTKKDFLFGLFASFSVRLTDAKPYSVGWSSDIRDAYCQDAMKNGPTFSARRFDSVPETLSKGEFGHYHIYEGNHKWYDCHGLFGGPVE